MSRLLISNFFSTLIKKYLEDVYAYFTLYCGGALLGRRKSGHKGSQERARIFDHGRAFYSSGMGRLTLKNNKLYCAGAEPLTCVPKMVFV